MLACARHIVATSSSGGAAVNCGTLRNLGIALNAGLLLVAPVTARAQSAPSTPFSADEIRSGYVQSGFQVDAPIAWWTTDQVTTMRVTDPRSERVLMVLV